MNSAPQKDIITRLADAGEDAINRLADLPGGTRLVDAVHALRVRMDEMQKKVRGIDELERRVAALEEQVATLTTASKSRPARPSASSTSSAKKPTSSSSE